MLTRMSEIRFIQARNYTPVTGAPRKIDLIVIHDMEAPESALTAENVGLWFAGPNAPQASTHYNIDSDSIVQNVLVKDVAWAAPGANHNGIQFEHAGYARQSAAEWLDPYSRSMLAISALLAAQLCKAHSIPARFVPSSGLVMGERGITTHAAVSESFGRSNHTDPGRNFPMRYYTRLVEEAMRPAIFRNWPVPLPQWFWAWAKWRINGSKGPRPATAPPVIPPWAWRRLKALLAARDV